MLERSASNVQFMLAGFSQEGGFRVFAFRRAGADRGAAEYSVRADLSLSRRHGIPMQDLPLLCRRLLEQQGDHEAHVFTFSETEMSAHATAARTAIPERKKTPRRPPNENLGSMWRGHQPAEKP